MQEQHVSHDLVGRAAQELLDLVAWISKGDSQDFIASLNTGASSTGSFASLTPSLSFSVGQSALSINQAVTEATTLGIGAPVVLVGLPGQGKTALMAHLAHTFAARAGTTLNEHAGGESSSSSSSCVADTMFLLTHFVGASSRSSGNFHPSPYVMSWLTPFCLFSLFFVLLLGRYSSYPFPFLP